MRDGQELPAGPLISFINVRPWYQAGLRSGLLTVEHSTVTEQKAELLREDLTEMDGVDEGPEGGETQW